ncbi:hypothetical protein [Candidatus Avelusimicrobium sp.]|uniref:hypothetical protein n=1 Tax=Candidatus Avelusimicrobium sp. TaxID=3048833 RepID=UPI003D7E7A6F
MKKFLTVALALLLTTGAFAQKRIEKNNVLDAKLAKAITAATQNKAGFESAVNVIKAYENFAKSVQAKQYHDFGYIFQAMDEVRVTFMAVQEKSPEAASQVAKYINRPVAIANGSYFLTLENYLRMETVNLTQGEQVKFDAFHTALENALNYADVITVNQALPKEYAESVVAFRKFVSGTKELKPNWILQSMMNPMDEFNAQLQKNPQLGPAMAKEFVKPIKAAWGTVEPVDFINEYAITLQGPVQDELFDFRDNLNRLAR